MFSSLVKNVIVYNMYCIYIIGVDMSDKSAIMLLYWTVQP